MARSDRTGRKAAVVGSPIGHSLSPVLHTAAYRELGLTGWSYERFDRDADGLAELVGSLGPEWAGLSVTMPGKRAALGLAKEVTDRAAAVGVANTLTRLGSGEWAADCTDVDGVTGALRAAGGFTGGRRALLLGAGGAAAAAVAAFAELGLAELTVAVREPARARDVVLTAEQVGLRVSVERLDSLDLGAAASEVDVLVSTLPAGAADPHAAELARAACVLDVIYHPWPTPLADAVSAAGGRLATGLDMLLHQAFGQVELFTGRTAPRAAMRDALLAATGGELALPL
ncbi:MULTISPECIES: shikimate dehydrogenase [unclassified Saccharopolyspora]|uniref:shikimate dehydrogenase n=1 Tax=unclassified Saccharopolyspora TaxID=2646250 RepID=UPI001CD6D8FF|nr:MULTISPECIES: shikimate dehydrogenase [unclassified Saccharopolyspora]MCA1190211.1 shikimate dehydrogenase [Saccharopolyspora sp. 6T]MCA1281219.1 shikimate dehydrogenase [Saccharopolyspora sp. 7B]